jgi:hypothetical protein
MRVSGEFAETEQFRESATFAQVGCFRIGDDTSRARLRTAIPADFLLKALGGHSVYGHRALLSAALPGGIAPAVSDRIGIEPKP